MISPFSQNPLENHLSGFRVSGRVGGSLREQDHVLPLRNENPQSGAILWIHRVHPYTQLLVMK